MSSRWVAGIDPGKSGAIAFLDLDGSRLAILDMPKAMLTTREGVCAAGCIAAFAALPAGAELLDVVIEDVHSMPNDGHVGAFAFGRSKGVVETAATAALGRPPRLVDAAAWKRAMRTTADKAVSLARASLLFPLCTRLWTAKSHDGRAEAALLALYGALKLGLTPAVKVSPHALQHPAAVKEKSPRRSAR